MSPSGGGGPGGLPRGAPPVVLITDYGYADTYAAALAGAVWRVEPELRCLTGTHGVAAGDVLAGAYHLKALALALPAGSVLCAVVDPGVGTSRRGLAVGAGGVLCVAPDNGLVSYLWEETRPQDRRAVSLPFPPSASPTFAGRDVFAPVAARLAAGASLDDVGPPVSDPVLLGDAFAQEEEGSLRGRVAVVDHFGNAITTVRETDLGGRRVVALSWPGGRTVEVVRTYDEIGVSLAALVGSAGHLEIASRRAPAAAAGGPGPGAPVVATVDG